MTSVWQLACWQVGAAVTLGRRSAATVVVVGPGDPTDASPGAPVLVCSLHPLGLPLTEPPPTGVLDYALEVRAQPDQHAAVPQSGLTLAWHDPASQLTQADLVTAPATGRRRLIRPENPWATTREALVAPLLGGGSSVVVAGPARPGQLARIADQEQADLAAGGDATRSRFRRPTRNPNPQDRCVAASTRGSRSLAAGLIPAGVVAAPARTTAR